MTPEGAEDGAARIAALEDFVRHVVDVGETLEIIGRRWGDDRGEAIAMYGAQLRQAAERVLATPPP